MDSKRWQLIKDLVEVALKLPSDERHKFIVKNCANDKDLMAEVISLIEYHQKANSFLEVPAINNLVKDVENKKNNPKNIPQTRSESIDKTLLYNSADDKYKTKAIINKNVQPNLLVDPFIGKTLDSQYEIEALLGMGGMGTVYRANHKLLKRQVAVKVMSSTITGDPTYRQLFIREGRAATLFNHPNAVTIYDLRETNEGIVYLVLEYVEGHTLSEELKKQGSFSIQQACKVIMPIAEALNAAHKKGVVHRDLKPANIMVSETEDLQPVKLLDLGLAKIQQNPTMTNVVGDLTISQNVLGTPYYMSPEHWAKDKNLDGRADIYSLGIILYELIAGYKPFNGATIEVLAHQHTVAIPIPLHKAIPGVPESLSNIILKAIAKDPNQRYLTCNELVEELKGVLNKVEDNDPLATIPITEVIVSANNSSQLPKTIKPNKSLKTIAFQNKKLLYGFAAFIIVLVVVFGKTLLTTNDLTDFTQGIENKSIPTLDLNGEWLAYGYCCGPGTEVERIMIRQTNNYIIATKITGDEYVPAGNTTFEGKLTGNTSKVQVRTADKGFTNPRWVEATIQILSIDEIFLRGNGFNVVFKKGLENKSTKNPLPISISGLWAYPDNTGDSILSVINSNDEVKVFIIAPSNELKNTYKWNRGDLKMQGKRTANKIVGKYFVHNPDIESKCPKQWISSDDMELTVVSKNIISGRRKGKIINQDCSLGEVITQTFVLIRKSTNK